MREPNVLCFWVGAVVALGDLGHGLVVGFSERSGCVDCELIIESEGVVDGSDKRDAMIAVCENSKSKVTKVVVLAQCNKAEE